MKGYGYPYRNEDLQPRAHVHGSRALQLLLARARFEKRGTRRLLHPLARLPEDCRSGEAPLLASSVARFPIRMGTPYKRNT